jgi:hypothetical protein
MNKLEPDELIISIMKLKMPKFMDFLNGFSKELLFMCVYNGTKEEKEILVDAATSLEKLADIIKEGMVD